MFYSEWHHGNLNQHAVVDDSEEAGFVLVRQDHPVLAWLQFRETLGQEQARRMAEANGGFVKVWRSDFEDGCRVVKESLGSY
jgi:hypothetical protein